LATTAALQYLRALADHGVKRLFANAGTDFAPLVEAYARNDDSHGLPLPEPVICAHENLAAGMAHGASLVTGEPQVVMFHVSVGTANAICAVANAARDNVPLLVTAGRTPLLEHGALGARDTNIHWAQEMFDQAGMVREFVKWDYELRNPHQIGPVVDRAVSLAVAAPAGPVYLALPREVLAEPGLDGEAPTVTVAQPSPPAPDPAAVRVLAERLATADFPVVLTSASGTDERCVDLLGTLCERYAIGVAEFVTRRMNLPMDHACSLGGQVKLAFDAADAILVLDADVPWITTRLAPPPSTWIAQAGVDPLFARYPMRSHRSDLTITTTTVALLTALHDALERLAPTIDPSRGERVASQAAIARSATDRLRSDEAARTGPITKAFLSMALGEALESGDIVFNEYWALPELLARTEPGSYFYLPPAGGLGWALPAALGARHARPDRTVVATVGDGAYMFANPAACHHAAAKHNLPVLTIVANNSSWGAVDYATQAVYPEGVAVARRDRRFSDLSPSPAYEQYCIASGGFGERVTERAGVAPAIARALATVREGRQALLNVECV
jgi:acetolactate synthase-1/2/3 large subunit